MITSASNPRLKLVRKLGSARQRAKLGLFACEGEDLVAAGLAAGLRPVEVLVDAEQPPHLGGLSSAEGVEPGLLAELSVLAPAVLSVPSAASRWARMNQWYCSSWWAWPISMSWVTRSSSSVESIAPRCASMIPAYTTSRAPRCAIASARPIL